MRLIGLIGVLNLILVSLVAEAQSADKVRTIGWLSAVSSTSATFLDGLRELGWIEGKNLIIERRFAEGNIPRLPDLAAELVRLRVELIVAGDSAAIGPARRATTTLPIVMTVSGDPVRSGWVVSLSRPGGNITGLSNVSPDLAGKRLELLKECVPRLSRVAVLGEPQHPDWSAIAVATTALGVELQALKVESRDQFEDAFQRAARERANGLIVLPSPLTNLNHIKLVALATRLPAVYPLRTYAEVGGLVAYGPSIPGLYRRAAYFVDRILKGASPADLPIEQPTQFDLVINLKTAKALGLTIPQSILVRADEVIQ